MLEKILKLYVMAMAYDVRSPMPHIVGPPGCGKSTMVEKAADLLGVNLHIINVARISPLDVEGVQMPHSITNENGDVSEEMILRMLPATFWTQLRKGDILLMDEFLRGFPEVYNALLDIFTSRRVGGFRLPRVFIIGASNSTVAYDKALEDRLLHLPVPDPRRNKKAKAELARHIIEGLGLMPAMKDSTEMQDLLDNEVLPMFNVLDSFNGKGSGGAQVKGHSVRNLIGQVQLREIQSTELRELVDENNRRAMREAKPQYVVLADGKLKSVPGNYVESATKIKDNDRLTEIQARNLDLNLQLIELEAARNEKEGSSNDEDSEFFADA